MEIHFTPEMEAKLEEMAQSSGCKPEELVADAVKVWFDELAQTREMLDSRYDDLANGSVEMIDGEEAFRLLMEKGKGREQHRRSA